MYKPVLLFLLALLVSAPAVANISAGGEAFQPGNGLDLSSSFNAQRDAIIKALDDGETYSEIAADDAQVVKASLARITSLLASSAGSVDQLPHNTKIQVFNEQERINTLLSRAHADSRMVCRREKVTGSNMSTNVCMTVGDRRRAAEAARDFMKNNPRAMSRPTET
ncbi:MULTISPECIES: hypothetical protein [unclassified Luteimonas]